jgi:cobalt-zinc-cadmium efflux system membrane fusion protein
VQKARADLEAIERDFKRQQELYTAHASSQKDYEASIGAFRKAKAELERAQQKARLLRTGDLDSITQEFTLRAPIEGGVIARNVNPGIEVQGLYSGGTAVELFTIGELDRVWIMADVPEMDVSRVHRGAKVRATVLAYPEKQFEGEIDWVADVLDPSMRTAKVRCIIPNPEHLLKPEMYAKVSISSSVAQVLAIPRSAILRLGDQSVVFVARGQSPDGKLRFERRPVKADEQETGGYVPIREGLKSGETIVTDGAIILSGMT